MSKRLPCVVLGVRKTMSPDEEFKIIGEKISRKTKK
jgi:hypothetical protein